MVEFAPKFTRVRLCHSGLCRNRHPTQGMIGTAGPRRVVVTRSGGNPRMRDGVELINLPLSEGRFAPASILRALVERGFRRILVEGGPATLSAFLAAGCVDRLHLLVAPLILGAGPAGLNLPPIARVDDAMRPTAPV